MAFIDTVHLLALQSSAVTQWHHQAVANHATGFERLVLKNHEINFRLWHEEDEARDPTASDATIAAVKRRIDRLNQQRSDAVEQLDNAVADELERCAVVTASSLPMNTETPGSAIDRLSILALRIYHLEEQAMRTDVDDAFRQRIDGSRRVAAQQRENLRSSLQRLLDDLMAGRKRHQTFRQLKMYNDPQLNPVLYRQHRDVRGTDR